MVGYAWEKDCEAMTTEVCLFKQALAEHKYGYNNREVFDVTFAELDNVSADLVPIGDLRFVAKQLSKQGYKMYPIEVPKILRTPEYLGREYHIVNFDELPEDGFWFIKDVGMLKGFSGLIYMDSLKDLCLSKEEKGHKWQYSSLLDLVAEYRFYVLDDKIITYALYACLSDSMGCFPDIKQVQKMVNIYSTVPHPKAYTIDIGVTRDGGTYIIEIHPFASVGIYNTNIFAGDLIDMYCNGYDWYKSEHNVAL